MKNITISIALLFSFSLSAIDFDLKSTEYQTQVIELFTSEGCSSCPPADRYLSELKKSKGLWSDFIPIALHVDYWDYIGWKDAFASQSNTVRQQMHKVLGNLNSVYTPGVLKAGKEWRAWRFADIVKSPVKVGKLDVSLNNNKLKVAFDRSSGSYNLNIALLAMNVTNTIKAGENQGKLLKHDFVLVKQNMYLAKTPIWEIDLSPSFFHSKHQDLAFVAWVETEENPAPLQAVGTFL